ncbi:unnamed protein product, partial [Rotaria socialis]
MSSHTPIDRAHRAASNG